MSDKVTDKLVKPAKQNRDALLAYLAQNGEISAAETAEIIGRSVKTAQRVLRQLADEGAVLATGANKNRKYLRVR